MFIFIQVLYWPTILYATGSQIKLTAITLIRCHYSLIQFTLKFIEEFKEYMTKLWFEYLQHVLMQERINCLCSNLVPRVLQGAGRREPWERGCLCSWEVK